MTLYNLKSDGDQYRITKFTNDLDVESSYILSETECECPAGSRPSCRHRQMLPTMLAEALCDSGGFYDFDNGQVLVPATEIIADDFEGMPDGVEKDYQREMQDEVEIELIATPEPIFNGVHPSIGPIKRRI